MGTALKIHWQPVSNAFSGASTLQHMRLEVSLFNLLFYIRAKVLIRFHK